MNASGFTVHTDQVTGVWIVGESTPDRIVHGINQNRVGHSGLFDHVFSQVNSLLVGVGLLDGIAVFVVAVIIEAYPGFASGPDGVGFPGKNEDIMNGVFIVFVKVDGGGNLPSIDVSRI